MMRLLLLALLVGAGQPAELAVARGDIEEHLVLTGELDAVSAENLTVPRTSQWQIQLRWLEEDGTAVKVGQRVAEFDNSAFVAELEEKKLAAIQAYDDLEKQKAQNALTIADKAFEVDKAQIGFEKAKLQASVAKDALPGRVWQENQLELERQRVALEKARDDLEATRKSSALEVRVKQIALDKSMREIQTAEKAISALVLRAPRDGIVVIADHPWEGRKLEVGDTIWVGLPVVRLPDLSTMRVKAFLSDVDEGRIAVGMKATCTLDAFPDRPLTGVIREISPVAREPSQKSQRRSFQVILSLDGADATNLLPGLSVRAVVHTKETRGVLVAPRAAIDFASKHLRAADGSDVSVEIGPCDPQRCEVRGVAAGLRLRGAE